MNRLTNDRAARRYLQIRGLEAQVETVEAAIETVQAEISSAEDRLSDLRKEKSELMKALREAAKDEGQLPLFAELVEGLVDLGLPRELLPAAGVGA